MAVPGPATKVTNKIQGITQRIRTAYPLPSVAAEVVCEGSYRRRQSRRAVGHPDLGQSVNPQDESSPKRERVSLRAAGVLVGTGAEGSAERGARHRAEGGEQPRESGGGQGDGQGAG